MNTITKILSVISLLFLPHLAMASTAPVMNPYGKFLSGNGLDVEMAQFAKKNKEGLYDVLLKMTGSEAFNAGIDGKTIKYEAVHGGTGIDYKLDGKTRMIVRNPFGDSWSIIQVFFGDKEISLGEDSARSKEVMPLHLLTAFKEDKS
ncbi:MAG: hypothetical protein PHD48_11120 [Alphaproteobacteria bacterium]|nr:hypothetical protein [Alphaproteobacteria bacterium]